MGPAPGSWGKLALSETAFSHSAFEQEQKLRKQEIVSRILKEEAGEHARKKQAPPKTTGRPSLRDKTWSHLAEVCDRKSTAPPSCPPLVSELLL